jgi:hypothetical protein
MFKKVRNIVKFLKFYKMNKSKIERLILWVTVIATAVWNAIQYIIAHVPTN